MHIDTLKYLTYIAKYKSISKAASKSHISQSALSQMIHKLEEDLGYELFIRSNRGVTLTDMGEIVLKYSTNIVKNHERMIEELEEYTSRTNKIIIAGTSSLASYSLPCMIFKIKKKFPDYEYVLVSKSVDEIISDVRNDLCTIGFTDAEIKNDPDLFTCKIGKEKIVLIANANYKVPDIISLHDLLNMELIMCTMNSKTYEKLDAALHTIDCSLKDLNVIFNSDFVSSVKSSVLNGYGMAFVPYESIKHELYEKSIKLVDIKDVNLDYDIYLVGKKSEKLSEASKASMDYLIEIGTKSFC
ncbi:LysR family transcriptional regulator [Oceanirhabdus sp. W0125-5]|uniref:LysR family transcriptional regulator n=1 Tax=Oceanirhabdus sp. W0125-5 TaxID=2999116 RepID=UPI0022F30952|nr:LysR family transcriptional regulator [Oceanirhabdus sp. W0125-5]WBW98868.1 LysR family transcriptional regulator [Oceanirhabdus sp. W0125-5]